MTGSVTRNVTGNVRSSVARPRAFIWLLAAAVCLALLAGQLRAPAAHAQTIPLDDWPALRLWKLLDGLEEPVYVTHAGDDSGRLFVVERAGRIRIVSRSGALLATPFLDITDRVSTSGECGLLSVAFPSDYASLGYFYVYYSAKADVARPAVGEPNGGCDTVIARFDAASNPNVADPASEIRILAVNQPYTNHNGGTIAFGPDGRLYIGLGDGGDGGDPHGLAQNPASLLGKMLRISPNPGGGYSSPSDNPFVDEPGYRDEIWALGLRNPFRWSFDRLNGDLFIADVGQGAWEEINYQPADGGGENYGWNRMEGDHCYPPSATTCDQTGLTDPVHVYGHSLGRSVTGGVVYRGSRWSGLAGIYLFADWGSGRIWGMRQANGQWETHQLLDTSYAIVGFGEDERGEVYVVDIEGGAIYRMEAGHTIQLPWIQRQ